MGRGGVQFRGFGFGPVQNAGDKRPGGRKQERGFVAEGEVGNLDYAWVNRSGDVPQVDSAGFAVAAFQLDYQRLLMDPDPIKEIGEFFSVLPMPSRLDAIADRFTRDKVALDFFVVSRPELSPHFDRNAASFGELDRLGIVDLHLDVRKVALQWGVHVADDGGERARFEYEGDPLLFDRVRDFFSYCRKHVLRSVSAGFVENSARSFTASDER